MSPIGPILDTIEILYAESVCRDETVKRENLVHLDGGNECAAALTNDMGDYEQIIFE